MRFELEHRATPTVVPNAFTPDQEYERWILTGDDSALEKIVVSGTACSRISLSQLRQSKSNEGDVVVLLGQRAVYWSNERRRFISVVNVDSATEVVASGGYALLLREDRWKVWKPTQEREQLTELPGNFRKPLLFGLPLKGYAITAVSDSEDEVVTFDVNSGVQQRAFKIPQVELLANCKRYVRDGELSVQCKTESGQSWNDSDAFYGRVVAVEKGPRRITDAYLLGNSLLATDWISQSFAWGTTVWQVPSMTVVASFVQFIRGVPESSYDITWPKPMFAGNVLVGVRHRFELGSPTMLEVIDVERSTRFEVPLPDFIDGVSMGGNASVLAIAGMTTPYLYNTTSRQWRSIVPRTNGGEVENSRIFTGKPRDGGLKRWELLLDDSLLVACDMTSYCELIRVSDGTIIWGGTAELTPRNVRPGVVCWSVSGKTMCVENDWKILTSQTTWHSVVEQGTSSEQILNKYCVSTGYVVPCSVCRDVLR
jgi:hypothetical protein